MLVGVLAGPQHDRSWFKGEGKLDFFDAKGILESIFAQFKIEASFEKAEDDMLLPGRTAKVIVKNIALGLLGEIHPIIADEFDISSRPVPFFEVDLEKLFLFAGKVYKFSPIPRFPGTVRDIALLIDAEVPAKSVQDLIQSFPQVSQVTLFDVYRGERIPPGKKSLAFSILYQSPTRTLTEKEISDAQQKILKRLEEEFGATLRK
jgi:phenylalanyl-tRNA synthetase beta chain